jgi:hypothetical protein
MGHELELLLPLFECEVDSRDRSEAGRIGALPRGPDSPGSISTESPVVYWELRDALMTGRHRSQIVYAWFQVSPVAGSSASGDGDPFHVQGIRMTLDDDGAPLLWEVLPRVRGQRLVFVSRRLEEAAGRVFGAPLPGRRYAIEGPIEDCPDTLVVRVLEDGPLPMGPWVYVERDGLTIRTLLCRCMPGQVDENVETLEYELAPLVGLRDDPPFARWIDPVLEAASDALDTGAAPLAACLRWPDEW